MQFGHFQGKNGRWAFLPAPSMLSLWEIAKVSVFRLLGIASSCSWWLSELYIWGAYHLGGSLQVGDFQAANQQTTRLNLKIGPQNPIRSSHDTLWEGNRLEQGCRWEGIRRSQTPSVLPVSEQKQRALYLSVKLWLPF